VYPPKAYALLGKLPEIAMDDALQAEAWAYMKANPRKTLEMTARKVFWFWTSPPENLLRTFGEGVAVRFHSVDTIYWGTVIGLAVLGVVTSRHPLGEYLAMIALYAVVYSAIYGITHVGQARFRGEIEFIFLFATAGGLQVVLNFFRNRLAPSQPNS
jgi:hypothetical protein